MVCRIQTINDSKVPRDMMMIINLTHKSTLVLYNDTCQVNGHGI